jgi:phosphatidylglycerophosphate synthase
MNADSPTIAPDRRPLETRRQAWAPKLARALDRVGFSPNGISVAGIVAALIGAGAMVSTRHVESVAITGGLFLFAALMIQTRLLANMMDGLVAVECGRGSPDGDFFNEVPDRLEDAVLLSAAGYAAGKLWLGELAALLAVSVAYLRAYRASRGLGQDFRGPGAKPHRMFVLTLSMCFAAAACFFRNDKDYAMGHPAIGLGIIVLLCLITLLRRSAKTLRDMRAPR